MFLYLTSNKPKMQQVENCRNSVTNDVMKLTLGISLSIDNISW